MGRERSAPDDWAWRAGAHGAGAQPGGRGAALRASRAVHSSGLPTACGSSAAGTRPRRFPTAEDGLQTHMHFAEGDLGNPASLLASLATLRTGAFPEVTQKKTKGQWGRRSRQKYPLVTTPTEEIQEAKLRTRAPPRIGSGLAGWLAGRPEGVQRPRWRCSRLGSCRKELGDDEVAVGRWDRLPRGEPRRQLNGSPVRARVSAPGVSRIRRSSAADT